MLKSNLLACFIILTVQLIAQTSDIEHHEIELFETGVVSTQYAERDMTISLDGNHLLYSMHSFKNDHRMIVESIRVNGQWQPPKTVSFSGKYRDLEPMFTPNGQQLFFASNRPLFAGDESQDYNIWVVYRLDKEWSEPSPLDTLINSDLDEFYPSLTTEETLYFTASYEYKKNKEDIYKSMLVDGQYQKPVRLSEEVNSVTYEFNSFVTPDERMLFFSSYGRKDGLGGGDLYVSQSYQGEWMKAINLSQIINSDGLDYCPFVSADGAYLYFTSNRIQQVDINTVSQLKSQMSSPLNGFDNIYRVPLQAVLSILQR